MKGPNQNASDKTHAVAKHPYFKQGDVQMPMTNWFSPSLLIKVAMEVVLSKIFGRYADKRESFAVFNELKIFDEYSEQEGDFWLDYVADLGDGWDATFTVAQCLAQDSLDVLDAERDCTLKRGRILVMGGDQVYPSSNRDAYRYRTKGPYKAALPKQASGERPDLYALPGNHDWYDSLVSFSRLFCQNRLFGRWQTRQQASYFALRLPRGWWFLGLDIQLEADIDGHQLHYFERVIESMQPNDQVIMATAVPAWVFAEVSGEAAAENIRFIEEKIQAAGAAIHVNVAGDLHHYARYSHEESQHHKITAGGGGAFLHGTHNLPGKVSECDLNGEKKTYASTASSIYPSRKQSQHLLLKNLGFIKNNPAFCCVIGFFYLLITWAVQSAGLSFDKNVLGAIQSLPFSFSSIPQVWQYLFEFSVVIFSPLSIALLGIFSLALVGFCEAPHHIRASSLFLYRLCMGIIHAATHLCALGVIIFLLLNMNKALNIFEPFTIGHRLLFIVEMLLASTAVSGIILGIYLYITARFLGCHEEASFSSSRIEGFKNFLRFKICQNGNLVIYPIGIDNVVKQWRYDATVDAKITSAYSLPEGRTYRDVARLIEAPIVVERRT